MTIVCAGARPPAAGIASAGPERDRGPRRQRADALRRDWRPRRSDRARASRRPSRRPRGAPRRDRCDDRRGARDARALHGAQAERSATDDGHARRGLDRHQRVRGRRAETGDAHAAAHHADVRRGQLREDRHDPFFERDHELGEAADVRVLVHGRAVVEIGDRHEIVRRRSRSGTGTCPSARAGTGSTRRTAACRRRRRDRRLARAGLLGRRLRRRRRRRDPG